jgi:hypothetical protein
LHCLSQAWHACFLCEHYMSSSDVYQVVKFCRRWQICCTVTWHPVLSQGKVLTNVDVLHLPPCLNLWIAVSPLSAWGLLHWSCNTCVPSLCLEETIIIPYLKYGVKKTFVCHVPRPSQCHGCSWILNRELIRRRFVITTDPQCLCV